MSEKSVFISHASADKKIVDGFVDAVLVLGAGVPKDSIAYTSREGLGVPLGESIPLFIKDSLGSSKIVLLFISDNYKNSEVCLNEMGAAWALDKKIVQILLPGTSFDKLGWLCSLEKAIRVSDSEALDSLFDELFQLDVCTGTKISDWNRNKRFFIDSLKAEISMPQDPLSATSLTCVEVPEESDDELGLIDYTAICYKGVADFTSTLGLITSSIQEGGSVMNEQSAKLTKYNASLPGNIKIIKSVLQVMANKMDIVSFSIENNLDDAYRQFDSTVDSCKSMFGIVTIDDDIRNEAVDSIKGLLSQMNYAKSSLSSVIETMKSTPNYEKSFHKAQKRLTGNFEKFNEFIDSCTQKAKELAIVLM